MDHGFEQFHFFMMISMQSSTMEQRCAMEYFFFSFFFYFFFRRCSYIGATSRSNHMVVDFWVSEVMGPHVNMRIAIELT